MKYWELLVCLKFATITYTILNPTSLSLSLSLSLCFVLRYFPLFISRALFGEGYLIGFTSVAPSVLIHSEGVKFLTLLDDNAFSYWGGSFFEMERFLRWVYCLR